MKNSSDMKDVFKRIIFVLYIIGFLLGTIIVFYIGWNAKPYQRVDPVKSIFICNNGLEKSLSSIKVFPSYNKKSYEDETTNKASLGSLDDQEIYNTCGIAGVKSLGLEDKTIGSWGDVFNTWIIGLGILWGILEILKGTIFYIVFGNWQGTYKNKGEGK